MSIKEIMIIIPAVFKFGTKIIKGYKNAKEKHREKEYIAAVKRGDIDAINRFLHS